MSWNQIGDVKNATRPSDDCEIKSGKGWAPPTHSVAPWLRVESTLGPSFYLHSCRSQNSSTALDPHIKPRIAPLIDPFQKPKYIPAASLSIPFLTRKLSAADGLLQYCSHDQANTNSLSPLSDSSCLPHSAHLLQASYSFHPAHLNIFSSSCSVRFIAVSLTALSTTTFSNPLPT